MSKIELLNASCADQSVDAVVNAANSGLWAGGGICGEIFKRAGLNDLTAACSKYNTPLKDGSTVYEETDIDSSRLSEETKQQLKEGIPVADVETLYSLLESYSS